MERVDQGPSGTEQVRPTEQFAWGRLFGLFTFLRSTLTYMAPGPIEETIDPSTVTLADFTRCTTNLMAAVVFNVQTQ